MRDMILSLCHMGPVTPVASRSATPTSISAPITKVLAIHSFRRTVYRRRQDYVRASTLWQKANRPDYVAAC